jgi:hypothetical protein
MLEMRWERCARQIPREHISSPFRWLELPRRSIGAGKTFAGTSKHDSALLFVLGTEGDLLQRLATLLSRPQLHGPQPQGLLGVQHRRRRGHAGEDLNLTWIASGRPRSRPDKQRGEGDGGSKGRRRGRRRAGVPEGAICAAAKPRRNFELI